VTIPVTGVNELVLEVEDLAAAERFYAGALGLPVVERWPEREAIWVLAGDRTRIGLWRPQVGVAGGRGGAHVHFALHLPEQDFDAAVARLREWELETHVEWHGRGRAGSRSVYVDDPDGNCVELWTQDVSRYARARSDDTAEHFDAIANAWDASYDAGTVRSHWQRTRLASVVELVGPGPGLLLDVGMGSGRVLEALAGSGWTVAGVDPASRMVELARARVPDAAERLQVGRAEDLPFPAESVDAVLAIGVLDYVQLCPAVAELARVLRPGGRAVIALRNSGAPAVVWQQHATLPVARRLKRLVPFGRPLPRQRRRPLSEGKARALLEAAGLRVERVEHVGCAVLPDPLDRFAPRLAARAARRAEASSRLRNVLGTQRLILTRKARAVDETSARVETSEVP
jgi:ubiquinone/menaquinone biosynthesis C-methylase UbiE/catechol 2,3-dioxygenase-like lactoylglutathione lyase family enzyme